jgi:hypothetical protein
MSRPRRTLSGERFACVPLRVLSARRTGGLRGDDAQVLVWLIVCAEYQDYRRKIATFTLPSLREELGWTRGQETLRRSIRRLEAGGWIRISVDGGRWQGTITGARRDAEALPSSVTAEAETRRSQHATTADPTPTGGDNRPWARGDREATAAFPETERSPENADGQRGEPGLLDTARGAPQDTRQKPVLEDGFGVRQLFDPKTSEVPREQARGDVVDHIHRAQRSQARSKRESR